MRLSRILKSFQKTIKRLDALVEQNDATLEVNDQRIEELLDTQADLNKERNQALKIKQNLQKLIGEE